MSRASREREREQIHLRQRRGFPTWELFREWQRINLQNYCGPFEPWPYPGPGPELTYQPEEEIQ